jgi:hypothetical protein
VRILHWTIGPNVERYVSQCLARVGREPVWLYMDETDLKDDTIRAGFHYHAHGEPNFFVGLRRSLTGSQAEITVAHEITHEVLCFEGYPVVELRDGQPPNPLASELQCQYSSCLSDAAIDLRLRNAGLRQDEKHEHLTQTWVDLLAKDIDFESPEHFEIDGIHLLCMSLLEGHYFERISRCAQRHPNARGLIASVRRKRELVSVNALSDPIAFKQSLERLIKRSAISSLLVVI